MEGHLALGHLLKYLECSMALSALEQLDLAPSPEGLETPLFVPAALPADVVIHGLSDWLMCRMGSRMDRRDH